MGVLSATRPGAACTGRIPSIVVSLPLVLCALLFGAAAGAFLPRITHRLAVPGHTPLRSACALCAEPFPDGPDGWVRAGAACPCSPAPWRSVAATAAVTGLLGATVDATPLLPVLLLAGVLGVVLAQIDLRCMRLPDRLVGGLAVICVVPLSLIEPGRIGRALL